jgi:hypothetical protein
MKLEAQKTATLGWPARLLATALLTALVLMVVPAAPASAARSISPPYGPYCGIYARRVSVGPPRVWASYRTEQVSWTSVIQRWDSYNRRWYDYATYTNWSSFNYYGQSVTSWSGGNYVNSRMNYPVYHRGYYRVKSDVRGNQGGVSWTGWVGGGTNCYVY